MKLKVEQVFDGCLVLSQIIREKRPAPQKGAYRLARMHAKLLPEFQTIAAQRDALITAYDHKVPSAIPGAPDENRVPDDKLTEFQEAWKKIAEEEIEVDVEPIPLSQLDLGDSVAASITASELITLGELVTG